MSASPNAANTTPSRFRSNVPSFSPSFSPSEPNANFGQQFAQPVFPPYMYGSSQMIPAQYYPYMAPYMMHPGASYSDYSAYAQAYQGYPFQMPYQVQPFTPSGNMNMNMGYMNMNKSRNSRQKSYGYNKPRSRSSSSVRNGYHSQKQTELQQPEKIEAKSGVDGVVPEEEEKSLKGGGDKVDKEEASKDTQQQRNEGEKPENINTKETTDVKNIKEEDGLRETMKYPLYFNENANEFIESYKGCIGRRQELKNDKRERMASLFKAKNLETKNLIINRNGKVTIIDHNANTTYTTNVNPNSNLEKNDDNDSGNVHSAQNQKFEKPKSTNWASFLQSTAPQPPKKVVPSKQSTTASSNVASVTSPKVLSTQASNSLQKADDDLSAETSQQLGVLLLRIMFDWNYSVLNVHNKCPIFKARARGLTNTGNICYMNAVLQVLLFAEPFNKTLKLLETKSMGSLSPESKTPVLDIITRFFNDFTLANTNKPITTDSCYLSLMNFKRFSHLRWGQQEDAEEFLGYLLDALHEEFVDAMRSLSSSEIDGLIQDKELRGSTSDVQKAEFRQHVKDTIKILKKTNPEANSGDVTSDSDNEGWSEAGANNKKISTRRAVEVEPSPITQIFGGQFRSVLQVPKRRENQSITLDPFQCVQLEISDPSINNIEDAFRHMNLTESIAYKPSSDKEVIAKKQTFIDTLPNILIIHLKRFSYQQKKDDQFASDTDNKGSPIVGGIEKLRKKVEYFHNFAIPPEVLSPLARKQSTGENYRLIGVIYHHGVSAEGGHYTCDVLRKSSLYDTEEESRKKKSDNEWIRIDDTLVSVIDKEDVVTNNSQDATKSAYILFYQKI